MTVLDALGHGHASPAWPVTPTGPTGSRSSHERDLPQPDWANTSEQLSAHPQSSTFAVRAVSVTPASHPFHSRVGPDVRGYPHLVADRNRRSWSRRTALAIGL